MHFRVRYSVTNKAQRVETRDEATLGELLAQCHALFECT